jgi:hypothetical protein
MSVSLIISNMRFHVVPMCYARVCRVSTVTNTSIAVSVPSCVMTRAMFRVTFAYPSRSRADLHDASFQYDCGFHMSEMEDRNDLEDGCYVFIAPI